jgi:hypothetical protein
LPMFSGRSTRFCTLLILVVGFCLAISSSNCFSVFLWIMQPLDVILAKNHRQIIALLEFIRYDYLPQIQQCSIKIMGILRYIQIIFIFSFCCVSSSCSILRHEISVMNSSVLVCLYMFLQLIYLWQF